MSSHHRVITQHRVITASASYHHSIISSHHCIMIETACDGQHAPLHPWQALDHVDACSLLPASADTQVMPMSCKIEPAEPRMRKQTLSAAA
eukprot:806737-Rhodomonas_salina.2